MSAIPEINVPVLEEARIPVGVVEKLRELYNILRKGRRFYEGLAWKLHDKQLQQSFFGIAQECSQYAAEIFSQLYCMGEHGGNAETESVDDKMLEAKETVEESISDAYELCEKEVLPAYRNLREEPVLIDELQEMMAYQMKGFLFYIEQLKLLRTSFG